MDESSQTVERRDGECFFFEGKPYACTSIGDGLCCGCCFRKDTGPGIDPYECTMTESQKRVFGPCGLEDRMDGEDVVFSPRDVGSALIDMAGRLEEIQALLPAMSPTGRPSVDSALDRLSKDAGSLKSALGIEIKGVK